MSNGSLQKVQFSEDDGRNNVAMQAALPAATNIKMMQGLELKSQVHKGVHGWENKWPSIPSFFEGSGENVRSGTQVQKIARVHFGKSVHGEY